MTRTRGEESVQPTGLDVADNRDPLKCYIKPTIADRFLDKKLVTVHLIPTRDRPGKPLESKLPASTTNATHHEGLMRPFMT